MPSPAELYTDLVDRAAAYKARYIDPFLPPDPGTPPSDYDFDVRSYCILCQASFEEYYEQVSQRLLTEIVDAWTLRKRASSATVALVACLGLSIKVPELDEDDETKVYDHIRECLNEGKTRFSKEIFDNHGASAKHLRSLLTAVGLDFTPDANSKNSIMQLSKNRGAFAHKGSVRSVLAPEDAVEFVSDFLAYSEKIRDKATEAIAALT